MLGEDPLQCCGVCACHDVVRVPAASWVLGMSWGGQSCPWLSVAMLRASLLSRPGLWAVGAALAKGMLSPCSLGL